VAKSFTLFKYRRIDKHLIDGLVRPSLFFARPAQLNDPFDCRLDWCSIFRNAAKAAPPAQKRVLLSLADNRDAVSGWNEIMSKAGVCSFSLIGTHRLMWSHYADGHRGVCVAYELPEAWINDRENEILGLDKVEYSTRPIFDVLGSLPNVKPDTLQEMLIRLSLTTKAPAWRYEREARLLRDPGALEIPANFIKQICFGVATPPEDVALLTTLSRQYCASARLARVTISPAGERLTLKRA
jgi:hypothetical protein